MHENNCWTRSVPAGFGRHGMPPPVCNPDLWPFGLETGVQVTSKVGNFHSKFGLSVLELLAMYATGGQKQRLLTPSIRSGA